MSNTNKKRVDEVARYYKPVSIINIFTDYLFWINAVLSFSMPYTESVLSNKCHDILKSLFIFFVLIYFVLSQISRFYLAPKAERMRRKQMLSDAFGTAMSHDRTLLYYNNNYSPSVIRLGANTMENALFSKEIATSMLIKKRSITAFYAIIWILAITLRHNNLEILTWITQLVFSGEIVASWIKLEMLRFRHERVYNQLHDHFHHSIGQETSNAKANIIDAFVAYESAKSAAGILLSTKVFNRLNPDLSKKWDQIRSDLNMDI